MTTPTIDELPPVPTRGEPGVIFRPKTAAFLSALIPFREQLNAATSWIALQVQAIADRVAQAGFSGTSTTSLTVSTGTKAFTLQTGLSLVAGAFALLLSQSSPASQYMAGRVTSYDPVTGATVFESTRAVGAGTNAAWKLTISGVEGSAGLGQEVGDRIDTVRTLGSGYLRCDGASYLRSAYPTLQAYLPDPVLALTAFTARTLPSSQSWSGHGFDGVNALFIAVANASTAAATSPDGQTWTARTLPASRQWKNVICGGGVALAFPEGTATDQAARSTDGGVTWAALTMPASGNFNGCYVPGYGFVVALSGTTSAYTSPDGVTWTLRTLPASFTNIAMAANNSGRVVIIGSGTSCAYSTDGGVTWTNSSIPMAGQSGMGWGAGLFIYAIFGSTSAYTSPDGITWTLRTLPSSSNWIKPIYGNGQFLMLTNTSVTAKSADGITWIAGPSHPSSVDFSLGAAGANRFVSVRNGGPSTSVSQSNLLADPTSFQMPTVTEPALLKSYLRAA